MCLLVCLYAQTEIRKLGKEVVLVNDLLASQQSKYETERGDLEERLQVLSLSLSLSLLFSSNCFSYLISYMLFLLPLINLPPHQRLAFSYHEMQSLSLSLLLSYFILSYLILSYNRFSSLVVLSLLFS